MRIDEIISLYNNLNAVYHNVISTFSACSSFGRPKQPFVNNTTKCINFDKVCDDFRLELKSADSLFLSKKCNCSYFIEFKNSVYDNVHEDIVGKAIDSTVIHNNVCNFKSYSDHKNAFVCVLSENKTMIKKGLLLSAYLKTAGYTLNDFYLKELESRFETAFKNGVINTKLPFVYDNFIILFDTSFDQFVLSIL